NTENTKATCRCRLEEEYTATAHASSWSVVYTFMHLCQPHANYLTGQILLKSNNLACASERFWFSRTNLLAPIGMHKSFCANCMSVKMDLKIDIGFILTANTGEHFKILRALLKIPSKPVT
ncbi:hypothetical protein PV325_006647, partial [Microctonus aethiopoides]